MCTTKYLWLQCLKVGWERPFASGLPCLVPSVQVPSVQVLSVRVALAKCRLCKCEMRALLQGLFLLHAQEHFVLIAHSCIHPHCLQLGKLTFLPLHPCMLESGLCRVYAGVLVDQLEGQLHPDL